MVTTDPQAEATMLRIAQRHYVTVERMRGPERNKYIQAARRAAADALQKQGYNTTQIGRIMERDPTTVLAMLGRIGARSQTND
jgi:chromosomal replication initiation ATPase DnaA